MSASDENAQTDDDDLSDRAATLARLDEVSDHAEYKVFGSGRIRDEEKERVKIKYLNVIVSAANAKRGLLKDKDLEDLSARLDRLEEKEEQEALG